MRILFAIVWGLVPLFGVAYHYGPGQEKVTLDRIDSILASAESSFESKDYKQAVQHYDDALALLPKDRIHDSRKIRLERNKVMMNAEQLPDSYLDLENLLDELSNDENADPKLLEETRSTMANAQYYVTWTVRLEGADKNQWEPIIEGSRQNYRLLAEDAKKSGDTEKQKYFQENLEAVIRLADLDLKELQAIPLPKQCKCKGCKGGCCNGNGKKKGKGKGKSKKKKKGNKDNRGASSGPPPDNSGS